MKTYKRHIADYTKKTARLTMLQHGAYNMLIDSCYEREQFPTRQEALEWTWAGSQAEEEAVDFILNRFFFKDESDIYFQKRIQEELDKHKSKSLINQQIAQERETNRGKKRTNRGKKPTNRERTVHDSSPDQHESLTNRAEVDSPIPDITTLSKTDAALWRAKKLFYVRKDRDVNLKLDPSEARSWATVKTLVTNTSEEDWKALEWIYAQSDADGEPGQYRRRNLATLLNNWNAAIAKAEQEMVKANKAESDSSDAWHPSRILQ